jgi:hypothetical protein
MRRDLELEALFPAEMVKILGQSDVLTSPGQTVASSCKHIGVASFIYYRGCKESGLLKTD